MSIQLQKAIIFATLKHQKQKRKGTDIPYIVHPMEVMQILTSLRCSETVILAGILHDTLEDTNTTPDEIKREFGNNVLDIVKSESEDKTKTWKERKYATIEHLKTVSEEAKQVCFADKLSNLLSMYRDKLAVGDALWKRFNASKQEIEWYYRGIASVLQNISMNKNIDSEKADFLFKEFLDTIDKVFSD